MDNNEKINSVEKFDINDILNSLKLRRSIFHNEQDFQFELAREIYEKIDNTNMDIRLEYFIGTEEMEEEKNKKTEKKQKRIYVDIMILNKIKDRTKNKKNAIAIELKYKTKGVKTNKTEDANCFELDNEEIYNLKNQGAKDWACYSVFKDLKRIEDLIFNNKKNDKIHYYNLKNIDVIKGYVIFLTNDNTYRNNKMSGLFENYSLNQNKNKKIIKNNLYEYMENGKPIDYNKNKDKHKSIDGKPPIEFTHSHTGKWTDYSEIKKDTINTDIDLIIDQLVFKLEKNRKNKY